MNVLLLHLQALLMDSGKPLLYGDSFTTVIISAFLKNINTLHFIRFSL